MSSNNNTRPRSVVGPDGSLLTLETLPAPSTKRWVPRRKAEVVTAVHEGLLTFEEACERYQLTEEEFASWERLITQHGMGGLRVTRLQEFR